MKLRTLVSMLIILIFLVACTENSTKDKDIKQLVHDHSLGNIADESASITSTQLIITDSNEKESALDLPENEFFLSIAPFINETHPCTNHNLTSCQGELVNKDFDINIEDTKGNVILEETMNSGANGFIDLWLPRDKTYLVQFSFEGKQVESEISTFETDGTCITTMQLS